MAVTSNIDDFEKLVDQILYDDDGLFFDVTCQAQDNKNVVYAIDTIEFFSFLFPLLSLPSTEYLLTEESPIKELAINETLLNHVFHSLQYKKTILPSHEQEVQALAGKISDFQQREVLEILKIEPDIDKAISSRALQKKLAGYTDQSKTTQDIQNVLFKEIPEVAPYIILLSRHDVDFSRNNFLELLEDENVKPIHHYFPNPQNLNLDTQLQKEAYDLFTQIRPGSSDGSNESDAHAIAFLDSINNSDPSQTFVLLTRAKSMHTVFRTLKEKAEYEKRLGNWIRYPRAFSPAIIADLSNSAVEDVLSRRRRSIELCMKALASESLDSFTLEDSQILDNKIEQFTETLSELSDLLLAKRLSDSSLKEQKPILKLKKAQIRKIGEIVTKTGHLSESIENISIKLLNEMRDSNILVTAFLESFSERPEWAHIAVEEHDGIEENAKVRSPSKSDRGSELPKGPYFVRSTDNKIITFSLEFYAPSLRKLFEVQTFGGTQLRSIIDKATQIGIRPFESRLALSYIFAIQGRWGLAYQFADAAVLADEHDDSRPRHEGYYFRTVCRRYDLKPTHSKDETERFLVSCLNDIYTACEIRDKSLGTGFDPIDPRYLSELGICAAVAAREKLDLGSHMQQFALPSDPISIWVSALRSNPQRELSLPEKLILLNNIVYIAFERKDNTLVAKYAEEFISLAKVICDHDFSKLPDNIAETVYVVFSEEEFDIVPKRELKALKKRLKNKPLDGIPGHETPSIGLSS